MKHQRHKFVKAGEYSNSELILLLKVWEQKHGEPPSKRSWNEAANTPSDGIYRIRFGGWGAALKIAGMEPRKPTISVQCRQATIKARKGKRSYNWKGGRYVDKRTGYVHIWNPEHLNAMKQGGWTGGKGYVLEHRLIMADYLGRPLKTHETVHHKNGIRDDNRIENLELMTKRVHRGQVECPHCGKDFVIR